MKAMWQRELLAGVTAFFAVSYIIIVHPLILADAGIPAELSVFSTLLVSIVGCLIMALWADAPILLTPGMGINAFFTYSVVGHRGLSWQEALAVSLVSGLLFAVVACTPCARYLARGVPASLKTAITVGIGLFLVEIGLEKAQLVRVDAAGLTLGSLANPVTLVALFGLVLSLALYLREVKGGFFLAILAASALGWLLGVRDGGMDVQLSHLARYPELIGRADFSHAASLPFWLSVFSMSMIMIFETMGLLEGILPDAGKFRRAFAGSALATILSALLGTSPTVAAAESAAGIAGGGRTGRTALVAAGLFALAFFFVPLLAYVPQAAIAPVIIITGAMMMQQLKYMEFDDFSEWFPAFLVVVLIPLTGSISTGLAFGFTAYPLLKVMGGRAREIPAVGYSLGFLFLMNLVFQAGF